MERLENLQSNQNQSRSMILTRIEKSTPQQRIQVSVAMESGNLFSIALYPDLAPNTVNNFINKVKSGFYNGLTFHRVEPNDEGRIWVIQGGDPLGNGTGGGDQSAEYNNRPFKSGSVGIARGADPNINNDSQFFITLMDASFLDKNYTNFGDVISGMGSVRNIKIGDKIKSISLIE